VRRLYIGTSVQAKVTAMVLLAQLFRHKSVPHDPSAAARQAEASEGGGNVRGLGAIAAAVGVRRQDGMPAEFELSLGELMARVPEKFIWLGKHDACRVMRIAAADVAPGLARGRAEISLARLVALAPDVFRWERGETDDPQIRLPIQKLLQQIGSYAATMPAQTAPVPDEPAPVQEERAPISEELPPVQEECAAAPAAVQPGEIVAEHLPSIIWNTPPEPEVPPAVETPLPPETVAPPVEESHAVAEATSTPEPEIPAPSVKPLPPVAVEHQPTISVSATEPVSGPVELRPHSDVSTSTTLRAVVLGGVGPSVTTAASTAPGFILAPRVTPVAGGAPPVILAPSVVPSANEGTAPPAHRRPDFAGLQNLFMTGVALDLAGVAALVAALPGVRACAISGAAGDAAAGNFSHGASPDEVRVASAEMTRKGGVATDTLHRGESDIALFFHDGVCVAAVLAAGSSVPGVRERLARVAELLAGTAPAR
jgi:hypothetical protein